MIPPGVTIFYATTPVDLRAGFDRLSGIVLEELRGDPRSGSLFLFTNRRRTHLKALFFDRTGYCILFKRLDRGTFPVPTVIAPGSSQTEISGAELALILEGLLPLPRREKGIPSARRKPTRAARRTTKKQNEEPIVH